MRIAGLILAGLMVGLWTPTAAAELSDDDFDAHIQRLKQKYPLDGFTIVRADPFVVIGDQQPQTVRDKPERTAKWAVTKLKAEYFSRDPNHIIDVFLFENKQSYERNCRRLFGITPHTPFGFYSSRHRALIMNISTGGGTLVHEIVHPYVAANFPKCPSWFNEGLGSLYEQSAERDGRIVGLTNWRLPGLQKAIREGKVPPFRELCSTTTKQFYEMDRGTNYAQARYLCYYLQQRGLLQTYYRSFVASVDDDPTGFRTLQRLLGEDGMDAFQKRWEQWVLTLRFPPSR